MDPYIGITGFTGPEEVAGALRVFPIDSKRKLMVGVLATYKSLRGIPMKPKWAKQTPKPEEIANIFLPDSRAINLVHLSTEEGKEDTLLADMLKVHELAGPHLHGFQLNVAWPQMNQLYTYRTIKDKKYQIVLQIGQKAVEKAGGTPEGVVKMIELYAENIDAILLDPSGGLGKKFDPERARQLLKAVADQDWGLNLGVAGGLGPDSLNLVEPLVGDFPDLNIDAQGRLRNEDNELDLQLADNYLKKALTIFA
ncbi:MAG: hypothetical protein WEC39_01715 [Patescibacteria group bacterium]